MSFALASLLFGISIIQASAIWYEPSPGTTFSLQLSGRLNTSIDAKVYIVDLDSTPLAVIERLHVNRRKVMCHFSAGTFEEWRMDSQLFHKQLIGTVHPKWSDVHWVDVRDDDLKEVMRLRFDRAFQKGCDGVHLGDVDGYMHVNGFDLTYDDQLTYNMWLVEQAHKRNLSAGLHNDVEQVPALVDHFDWTLNDMCLEFAICDALYPFVTAGKAVFGVELRQRQFPAKFCPLMNLRGFSWQKKYENLNASYIDCLDHSTWKNF